jgi:hypothetical protein
MLAVVAAAAVVARNAVAQRVFTFESPHLVRAPAASLNLELGQSFDAHAAAAKITTPDGLVAFGLSATADSLHFGLGHRTRISFDAAEREGNCVEYAELFATIVNRERGKVDARAWVVRSDARILGETARDPAWKDHDWVLVVVGTPAGMKRLYVDPTLYDMGLGWDISGAVHGDVRPP